MAKEIVIIGGGIIGLCAAYYLNRAGHKVTVVDQSDMSSGASYVNAGYLSPSHIIPLSAPGVMKKGIKWMFNPKSPLYIRPSLDPDFLRWTWAFNKSCNSAHVQRSAPIIRDISVLSQTLFKSIIDDEDFKTHYVRKGLIMLCQTQKGLDSEIAMSELATTLNLETKVVTESEIKSMEPNVEIDTIGGVYYLCDHHSTPGEFMNALIKTLKEKGVEIFINEEVLDFEIKGNKITSVITNENTIDSDFFVLASGAWSGKWNNKLGLNLLMQAGKGYRINSYRETGISIPAILAEAKAAVTPMNGFTRFAGTMEIAGINHKINTVRVDAIAEAIHRYYPSIELTKEEKDNAACGLRPVTPDGLPYIGRTSKYSNLIISAGHAMMGWSMSTATGLLVSQIIDDENTAMPIDAFDPNRNF